MERDIEILAKYRTRDCDSCGKARPSDPDHIGTRGAGWGDFDWNLWSLCRPCHTTRHAKGIIFLINKRPILIKHLLECKGWIIDDNKLRQVKWNRDGSEKDSQ